MVAELFIIQTLLPLNIILMKHVENLFDPIMQSDRIQSLDIMRGIVLFAV